MYPNDTKLTSQPSITTLQIDILWLVALPKCICQTLVWEPSDVSLEPPGVSLGDHQALASVDGCWNQLALGWDNQALVQREKEKLCQLLLSLCCHSK